MTQSPLEYVVAHWSKLFEGFSTSSDKFYAAVEKALERRDLPEARIRRVEWSEGGVLSPHRDYLRIEGSGFVFDLCASSFGNGFFFSWWLTRKRPGQRDLWFLAFAIATWYTYKGFGPVVAEILRAARSPDLWLLAGLLGSPFVLLPLAALLVMTTVYMAARIGLRAPEEAIQAMPVLGWIYEQVFTPITFYRLDTAAMFRATVHAAVLEVIDDLTTQKGVRALAPEERTPILRGLS